MLQGGDSVANCTICSKIPKKMRDEIDIKLTDGVAITTLAAEYFPDKPHKTAEAIITRHRDQGHIMQKAKALGALEIQNEPLAVIKYSDMVNKIFERALSLSMKAEAVASTSRDFESSAKCLDIAVKSLALIGISKEDKEVSGITALEEYIAIQRAKKAQSCN